MIGDDGFVGGVLLFHRRFETADTFSDSFAELGQLLSPNTSNAIPKITNRCVGCNSPSNMNPPFIESFRTSQYETCRRRFRARETAPSISGFIRQRRKTPPFRAEI
jgi:hypothetical protein